MSKNSHLNRNIIISAISFLMCCTLFMMTGCGDDFSSKNYTTIASEFTEALYSKDYETAATYVDEEYSDNLDEDAMEETLLGTQQTYGLFNEITYVEDTDMETFFSDIGDTSGSYASNTDYAVVYMEVSFVKGDTVIYFFLNKDTRKICGMTVLGTEEQTGNTEDEDTYTEDDYINDLNDSGDSPY